MRYPSIEQNYSIPLLCTSYIGHPASTDGTGIGTADTIIAALNSFGLDNTDLRAGLKGSSNDGAFLNTSVRFFINPPCVAIPYQVPTLL